MCRSYGTRLAVIVAAFILGSCLSVAASYRCNEYGIGVLGLQYDFHNSAVVLFDSPNLMSDTVAIWKPDSVRFVVGDSAFHSRMRMLEYANEIVGFPILEFSKDTAWVKVACDCGDTSGASAAWVRVDRKVHDVRTWTEILSDKLLFFRRPEDAHFHASAGDTSQLVIDLTKFERSGRLDYIMYPQSIVGNWMEVVVETPSTYGKEVDNPKRVRCWIRFLDDNFRPLVYFYTRGC